ncbi:hypothetical protein AAHN93_02855 [Vandammella animalimorsus]|uniref:BrnT family toxin n=1 Tax=Vandammella animalimorsus TaxID=2029117 RepID=UPI0031BB7E93
MEFEWDADKAAINFKKHGIHFEDAKFVFGDPGRIETYDGSRGLFAPLQEIALEPAGAEHKAATAARLDALRGLPTPWAAPAGSNPLGRHEKPLRSALPVLGVSTYALQRAP